MKEKNVDVMITDIRMPECDGMELIEKTKALHPEIHFVIISGYSQFDYAQDAIRYGVEDYLLKPIRKKDLLATLQKISEKYKVELKNVAKWETMQKNLKENEKKLKGNHLYDMISRAEEFAGMGYEQINKEYHCHFSDDIYQIAVIKPILASRDSKTMNQIRLWKK